MLYPVCFLHTISKDKIQISDPKLPYQVVQKAVALFGDTEASYISSGTIKKSVPQVVTLFAPVETSPRVSIYSTVPLAKLSGKVTVSRQIGEREFASVGTEECKGLQKRLV